MQRKNQRIYCTVARYPAIWIEGYDPTAHIRAKPMQKNEKTGRSRGFARVRSGLSRPMRLQMIQNSASKISSSSQTEESSGTVRSSRSV